MTTKVRKQIYIDPLQEIRLKQISNATGLSEAEIIRRTLSARLNATNERPRDLSAWERELRFIDQWIAQGAVEGGRTWKREDLYDR